MHLIRESEEVIYTDDPIVRVGSEEIEFLKKSALENRRQRIRLCGHQSVDDGVHEMLIVHTRGTYVRPHKHLNKSESFHVVEGEADIVVFDDAGRVTDLIGMGPAASGREFYYRLNAAHFHTLLIHTAFFVFHETTAGPFRRTDTVFAPWAPGEDDAVAVAHFMDTTRKAMGALRVK